MGISKKLQFIIDNAKSTFETKQTASLELLTKTTEDLNTSASLFQSNYKKNKKKFEENYDEFRKKTIVKNKLEFVDETGKTPAVQRAWQVGILKRLRSYCLTAAEQSNTVDATKAANTDLEGQLDDMDKLDECTKEHKNITATALNNIAKKTKSFCRLMSLLFFVLLAAAAAVLYFTMSSENYLNLILPGVCLGVWVILLIVFCTVSSSLRKTFSGILNEAARQYKASWLDIYAAQYKEAAAKIREVKDAENAIADLEEMSDTYLTELGEYYLAFLPENIVYIITSVIDGMETGLSFGETVWRSDDRNLAARRHDELRKDYNVFKAHFETIEDNQAKQLSATHKQIAETQKQTSAIHAQTAETQKQTSAIHAQTAATAAQTAATVAQTVAINKQTAAVKDLASAERSTKSVHVDHYYH